MKEEISDEKCKLPCYQGRVVSWLVPIEGAKNEKGNEISVSQLLALFDISNSS